MPQVFEVVFSTSVIMQIESKGGGMGWGGVGRAVGTGGEP